VFSGWMSMGSSGLVFLAGRDRCRRDHKGGDPLVEDLVVRVDELDPDFVRPGRKAVEDQGLAARVSPVPGRVTMATVVLRRVYMKDATDWLRVEADERGHASPAAGHLPAQQLDEANAGLGPRLAARAGGSAPQRRQRPDAGLGGTGARAQARATVRLRKSSMRRAMSSPCVSSAK
jgi:hypothetical protein